MLCAQAAKTVQFYVSHNYVSIYVICVVISPDFKFVSHF